MARANAGSLMSVSISTSSIAGLEARAELAA